MDKIESLEVFYQRKFGWLPDNIKTALALGFTEVTHFNNFFKKHGALTPLKFRNP